MLSSVLTEKKCVLVFKFLLASPVFILIISNHTMHVVLWPFHAVGQGIQISFISY